MFVTYRHSCYIISMFVTYRHRCYFIDVMFVTHRHRCYLINLMFFTYRDSCYLINSSLQGRKEGNVLFNDALNTFYLRLYGVRHMVKDHSYSEKGNPLPPHWLLFPICSKGSFICTMPQQNITYHSFVTPVVEHWLERETAQWVHPMKDRSDDTSHHERTLLPRSYISLPSLQVHGCNLVLQAPMSYAVDLRSIPVSDPLFCKTFLMLV